jgi:hypothetical protein
MARLLVFSEFWEFGNNTGGDVDFVTAGGCGAYLYTVHNRVTISPLSESNGTTLRIAWKVYLAGSEASLYTNETMVEPEAYWLLEEPQFGTGSVLASTLYWYIVGRPVFALTYNMLVGENNADGYIKWVTGVIDRLIPNVYMRAPVVAVPFAVSLRGGVCHDHAFATAIIANDAGNLPVALISSSVPWMPKEGIRLHMISIIVLPSKSCLRGDVELPFDYDGDGVNDTAIVLRDTANMDGDDLKAFILWAYGYDYPYNGFNGPGNDVLLYPGGYLFPDTLAIHDYEGHHVLLFDLPRATGLIEYLKVLPEPMATTPIDNISRMLEPIAVDVSTGKRMVSRDITDIVLDPDYIIGEIVNPDDVYLIETYFWKIWSVIDYKSPEELLDKMRSISDDVHCTEYEYLYYHTREMKPLPIDTIQEIFYILLKQTFPQPSFNPPNPPVQNTVQQPPTLAQLHPQLIGQQG